MATLFEIVKGLFDQDKWNYEQVEGRDILKMGYKADNNAWTCYAQVLEDDQQFVFYSMAPAIVPRKKKWLALEYLARANFSLIVGNFEMDFDSGEVRYKTSIDVEGSTLTYELFKPIIYANLFLMERYLPGLQAVLFEEIMPRQAIEALEG
jgi:hypothetical protein